MERRQFIKQMGMAGLGASVLAATHELGTAHAQTDVYLPSVMTGGDSAEAQTVDPATGELPALNNGTSGPTILVAASNAPATVRNAAQYRCNGTNDHNTINQAINDLQPTGGLVQLSEGTFNCSGPIRVARRTTLFGRGRATQLKAQGNWNAHDGTWPGAVIEPKDNGTDKTWIGSLAIDGNQWNGKADTKGIYYNITTKANFDEGPDPAHYFTDLYIHDTKRHAFHLKGKQNRGNKIARVRVWNPGEDGGNNPAHGFYLQCPDSYYLQCECGSASGSGFYVDGSSCHFVSCKSWYSDQSGWQVRSVRGNYSACEAQDNEEHGYYITSGPNSFTSCSADSNSWNRDNPQSIADGFHIPWGKNIQLIGCSSYDKNEGNRGKWQRHGIFMGSSCKHCQVIATTRDNRSSKLGGNVDQSQKHDYD